MTLDAHVRRDPRRLGRAGCPLVVVASLAAMIVAALVTGGGEDHAYGQFSATRTLLLVLTVPAIATLTLLGIVVTWLRWWSRVLVEPEPVEARVGWLAAAVAAVSLLIGGWGHLVDLGFAFTAVAAVTCLVLAASSELLYRGIVLWYLRDADCDESVVAAWSSAIFAAGTMALLLVETPATLPQLVALAVLGDVWYLLRRASGGVIVPSAVHGFLIFGLLSSRWGTPQAAGLLDVIGLVALVMIGASALVLRRRIEPRDAGTPTRKLLGHAGLGLLVVVAILVLAAVIPVSSRNLDADPDPARSYDEATARFDEIVAAEADADVLDQCRSRLLEHGEPTAASIVLFHGLTNCPRQFVELAEQIYDEGANVLILRAPHHGLADDSGGAIGDVGLVGSLTAQELRDYADTAIDIATGLGEEVEVLGLSMGGVVAMWTAQNRDVSRVVAVAPAISIPGVPHFMTTGLINLATRLPNISLPSSGVELDHTYAGESTGALAAMFLLAQANENELTHNRSAAAEVIVVLNPDDEQVDFDDVQNLVDGWEDADGTVEVVELPAVGMPHDVIDVQQPTGDVELVYPILVNLLEQPL